MRPPRVKIVAIVVVIILIMIVLVSRPAIKRYTTMLGGMWIGDPGFLKKSGLSDMQLYIAPGGSHRQGYLIMTDTGGGFVANQALEFRFNFGMFPSKFLKAVKSSLRPAGDSISGSVVVDLDEGETIESPFPRDLRMTLSLVENSMTLFNDQKVFAYLYRDPIASHAANVAYEGPV
jgi:hypothetical protein